MSTLAIALALRQAGESYQLVGTASALFAIASGIGGAALGRAVDRLGQPRVLVPAACLSGGGFALVALSPDTRWTVLLGSVVAGLAAPPLEPCLLALWPSLVGTKQKAVDAAYALNAGSQQLIFIVGPLLVVGLAAIGPARSALWAAAALGLLGSLIMATSTPSKAWTTAPPRRRWLGALHSPGLVVMLIALTGSGWAIGSFNVFTIAYAEQHPIPGGAGTLMAIASIGALAGTAVSQSRHPRKTAALPVIAAAAATLMAAAYWLLALVPGPTATALVSLLAGVFFTPLLTAAFTLTPQQAPPGTITEAFAWLATAVAAGIAGGSALCGTLLADASLHAAGVNAAAGVTLCALLLVAFHRLLKHPAVPSSRSAPPIPDAV
ncbi:MFS transporter [Streptomyces sp. NPDC127084]|uniref:MFS transporter n=1 Tax=Streptomyces sp. NPDC127084 TaxID=3347133 RepID=UPI0036551425